MTETAEKKTLTMRFLDGVERVCKKLPPPSIMFTGLFVITALIAAAFSLSGVELLNPATGKMVSTQNFFSVQGLEWLLLNLTKNFTGYAPMGLGMAMTLTIGLCD